MNDTKPRSEIWSKLAQGNTDAKKLVDQSWSRRIADAETIEQRKAIENCRRIYGQFYP